MDNQTRISQLFSTYEQMELNLELSRKHLTALEALYVERVIEYRRDQLTLLAEVEREGGPSAELKKTIAAGLGAAATCYEHQLIETLKRLTERSMMQFIEITSESGAAVEIPAHQVSYLYRVPLEPNYVLGLRGAVIKVPNAASPFDKTKGKLLDSGIRFIVFPIPEGTDAVINPANILFITPLELDKTVIMYSGGQKVIVAEGINTVRQKLIGQSIIGA